MSVRGDYHGEWHSKQRARCAFQKKKKQSNKAIQCVFEESACLLQQDCSAGLGGKVAGDKVRQLPRKTPHCNQLS